MATADLDLARSIYAALEPDDFGHVAVGDLYTEFFHPHSELVLPAIFPDTEPSYSGLDGLRDGRGTRLEVFLDRQAALEAAGVEE